MPVHVGKRSGKYRILEHDGKVAKTEQGNARDGGGHESEEEAKRQMRAINRSLQKKR